MVLLQCFHASIQRLTIQSMAPPRKPKGKLIRKTTAKALWNSHRKTVLYLPRSVLSRSPPLLKVISRRMHNTISERVDCSRSQSYNPSHA
mmetsp:Transcript_23724/g.42425  ORF Transcript_23724/g.42425 Transcript_23724/m.42425 type:complete len:90 (+) Transcript_23724:254-523(+)